MLSSLRLSLLSRRCLRILKNSKLLFVRNEKGILDVANKCQSFEAELSKLNSTVNAITMTDMIEKCLNVKLTTFESSISTMLLDFKKFEAAVCSNEMGILDVAEKCQLFETELNKLNSAVNDVSVSNSACVSDSKQLQKSFSDLLAHNKTLSTNCAALKKELNDMSSYMRRDNLIFHGLVPSSFVDSMAAPNASSDAADLSTDVSNTATELTVIQFCSDVLGVNLSLDDISVAHRLPVRNKQPHDAPASTPIIVKFTNRRARERQCPQHQETAERSVS